MNTRTVNLKLSVLLHDDERRTMNDRAIGVELAQDVKAALVAELEENGLGTESQYYVDSVEAHPVFTHDDYNTHEVDATLCVFDELIGMLVWAADKRKFKKSESPEHVKRFALYIENIQQNQGGTPELRSKAMAYGKVIESIWLDMTALKLNEHWDGAWDFEYVPQVLINAWLLCEEDFPLEGAREFWLQASLQALGYKSKNIQGAKIENVLRGYPELGEQLRHISDTYQDILDRVGADVLSDHTIEPSSTIADELNALTRAFSVVHHG